VLDIIEVDFFHPRGVGPLHSDSYWQYSSGVWIICSTSRAISWDQCETSITWHFASNKFFFFKLQLMFYFLFNIYYECIETSGESIVRNIWILEKFEFLGCVVIFQKLEFLGCILVWKWFSSFLWWTIKVVGVDDTRCQGRSVKGTRTLWIFMINMLPNSFIRQQW